MAQQNLNPESLAPEPETLTMQFQHIHYIVHDLCNGKDVWDTI